MSNERSCCSQNSECQFARSYAIRDRVFATSWLIVMAISLYDASLLFTLRDVIGYTERNPIGLWLIETCGSVWLFIVLKIVGTLCVCTVLQIMYQSHRNVGLIVVLALAAFQLLLLSYLLL